VLDLLLAAGRVDCQLAGLGSEVGADGLFNQYMAQTGAMARSELQLQGVCRTECQPVCERGGGGGGKKWPLKGCPLGI